MITIYTIGFTKKDARRFFELLKKAKIEKLIDIRVNNSSQLAGFAKGVDLKYFCKTILDSEYIHIPDLAPTKELLKSYTNKETTWIQYEKIFTKLLQERMVLKKYDINIFNNSCLLCSEDTPECCHRRLVAEYLKKEHPEQDVKIIHLV